MTQKLFRDDFAFFNDDLLGVCEAFERTSWSFVAARKRKKKKKRREKKQEKKEEEEEDKEENNEKTKNQEDDETKLEVTKTEEKE